MARPYLFANIVDNTGTFAAFGVPTLNNAGTVLFSGNSDLFIPEFSGVYRGHASGSVAPVYQTALRNNQFFNLRINEAGDAAFVAAEGTIWRIYKNTNVIADTTGAYKQFYNFLDSSPLIGPDGRVVFNARLTNDKAGIYDGPDPVANKLIDEDGAVGIPNLMHIGADNQIYFRGLNPFAFYRNPASPTPAIDLSEFNNPSDFQINAAGQMLFGSFFSVNNVMHRGLFTGPEVQQDVFVDTTSGVFTDIGLADLNSAGEVAFFANVTGGASGIFTGPDPVADKVIATGDVLFGATVTRVQFAKGLNDNGEVAFYYELNNGRSGIAVAMVPEPTAAAACAGLCSMAILRRRAHRSVRR